MRGIDSEPTRTSRTPEQRNSKRKLDLAQVDRQSILQQIFQIR
jgi:hypothetical protein